MFEIVDDGLMMLIIVIMWELSVSKFKLYGNYPKVVDYLLKWQFNPKNVFMGLTKLIIFDFKSVNLKTKLSVVASEKK